MDSSLKQMCKDLAEYAFRDHPLGTDENVDTLGEMIMRAVFDCISAIEAEDDK